MVDCTIAPGVDHAMTEHGIEKDDAKLIYEKVMNADILILDTVPHYLQVDQQTQPHQQNPP